MDLFLKNKLWQKSRNFEDVIIVPNQLRLIKKEIPVSLEEEASQDEFYSSEKMNIITSSISLEENSQVSDRTSNPDNVLIPTF